MKICLYLEFFHFWNGRLYKKIGTGLLSSYRNQKVMMTELGIPYVEKWDDSCDILQINTPWLKSIYLIGKAKRQGKKVIIWSHVTVEDAMAVFCFMPLIAPLFKKYLIYVYGLADSIFAPTEYTKKLLVAYGLPSAKVVVQSNAVNMKRYYKDKAEKVSGMKKYDLRTLTVGGMGLVIPRKGIDTFLAMTAKFPQNDFIWFGKIYFSLLVKPLPKKLSPNVKFPGNTDEVNEALNAIDIFLFPSYEENEGMAILEAAAASLPILVRDIPVYNDWLIHGKNCLKAKNNKEFEKYLGQLINDKNLRDRLGQAARKMAEGKSIEKLSQKAMEEYKRLLA